METSKLQELAAKSPASYTDEDRALIRELSEEMGVEFKPRKRCPNCYADQVALLWRQMRAEETACSYQLKPGIDTIWRGVRVNADTLTDEMAEQLLEEGFPALLLWKK